MDKEQKKGEALNQISRILFDKSSNIWFLSVLIEFLAALGFITSKVLDLNEFIVAIAGILMSSYAYYLKLTFEELYDTAESMRRQSVLTESLGWPIEATQFSLWKQKAGSIALSIFRQKARNADYYVTKEKQGWKKLLEMTIESAFWTRNLYQKILNIIFHILILSIVIILISLLLTVKGNYPTTIQDLVSNTILIFLSLALSIDLVGWSLRTKRLVNSIIDIEKSLERIHKSEDVNIEQVLRLVFEYNCQVAVGFPIPKQLFAACHDEIQQLWQER